MEKKIIQEAEEQLKRALLMMKYDTSKTLTENKEQIQEQTVISAAKDTAKGAATVATASAAAGSVIGPPGIIIGATVGLVASFFGNPRSDTAKKLFDGCKTDKSTPTLDWKTLTQIADDLHDAVEKTYLGIIPGTNEDKIKSSFSAIPTIPDLCGVVKKYEFHGDLWEDLMGDLENQGEWKDYVLAPLRPAMDKSNEIQNKQRDCKEGEVYNEKTQKCESAKKTGSGSSQYTFCPKPPFELYCKNESIKKVQNCLGVKADGYLGPITQTALKNVEVQLPLDQTGIDKACKSSQSGTQQTTANNPYSNWTSEEPEVGESPSTNKPENDNTEG